MTEIRIIGGARRRRDMIPARATLACLLGAAFLALFAAAALAADGLTGLVEANDAPSPERGLLAALTLWRIQNRR